MTTTNKIIKIKSKNQKNQENPKITKKPNKY